MAFSFRNLVRKRAGIGRGSYGDDTEGTEDGGWEAGGRSALSCTGDDEINIKGMDAGALLERARRMEASGFGGYQSEALLCIEACIDKDHTLAAALVVKAKLMLDYRSDPGAAAECANASLTAKSRNPDAMFMLGFVANCTEAAEAMIDSALGLYPYHSDSMRLRGLLLLRGGAKDTRRGIETLEKAAREASLDPIPLVSLAYAHSLCGDAIEAMRCVSAAKGLARGRVTLASVAADRAEAYLLRRKGQLDDAKLVLEMCIGDVLGHDGADARLSVKHSAALRSEFSQACVEHALLVNATAKAAGGGEAMRGLRDALEAAPNSHRILLGMAALETARRVPVGFGAARALLEEAESARRGGNALCDALLWPSTERAWSVASLRAELERCEAWYERQEVLKVTEGWAHWPYGMVGARFRPLFCHVHSRELPPLM